MRRPETISCRSMLGMDGKKAADLDGKIGWLPAQRHEGKLLADGDFVRGVEDEVVGQAHILLKVRIFTARWAR